jgi:hypothetical protein
LSLSTKRRKDRDRRIILKLIAAAETNDKLCFLPFILKPSTKGINWFVLAVIVMPYVINGQMPSHQRLIFGTGEKSDKHYLNATKFFHIF